MFIHSLSQSKKRKGFSLIEALIAILIFSIAMAILMGTFSVFLKNYANGKKIQKDIENAQYAMNIMAKTLRTSGLRANTAAFPLDVYDYSQSKCIRYDYAGNKIWVAATADPAPSDPSACTWASITPYTDLTPDNITDASISATKTANNIFGLVTISLSVKDSGGGTSAIPIQMSVSLRQ